MDPYAPVKGKCTWWREVLHEEDLYDSTLKPAERRVKCSCFVEGYQWEFPLAEVPVECLRANNCRYYIKSR